MALTPLHVQDVCYGAASQVNPWGWNPSGNVCKYLSHEIVGQKFVALCLKKAPGILEEKKKKGELPHDFNKLGDNCPGYRYMKHIDQGYDVPKS
jgi:hypothetical protein